MCIRDRYVSAHYKNSPNDLLLMADAPAHRLFVLLGPVDETQNTLPEILTVVQVCLEGALARGLVAKHLTQGNAGRAAGDLIPWTVSQQFQDEDFAALSGARVVRIATHPDYQGMGYGSRALSLLKSFYSGEFGVLNEDDEANGSDNMQQDDVDDNDALNNEVIEPRKNLPPLLQRLDEAKAPKLHWLGVAYGVVLPLYRFWRRAEFLPVYLRQTQNDLTGEHTCIMLYSIPERISGNHNSAQTIGNTNWLQAFHNDFRRRFIDLLAFQFSSIAPKFALSILDFEPNGSNSGALRAGDTVLPKEELDQIFLPWDLKRLQSYSKRIVDYHVIIDLVRRIAELFFAGRMGRHVRLSWHQAEILLAVGLQHKLVEGLADELELEVNQILVFFNQTIKTIHKFFTRAIKRDLAKELPEAKAAKAVTMHALTEGLDEELQDAGSLEQQVMKEKQLELLGGLSEEYAIKGSDADWDRDLAESTKRRKAPASITISRTEVVTEGSTTTAIAAAASKTTAKKKKKKKKKKRKKR
eukprot:TRINITY_DN570_c0_g1_i3.p1 TRINITY_DN570_c0_g1~~TRINITY_DN570_c0_g1_i3.p1  ORF type:complete len:526 (+),score=126.68 TRINITY_DN570_c0_g1_i3:44-1621(+)